MTLFIFAGDMFVMAFMVGVAIWFGTRGKAESAVAAARIPLEDEVFVEAARPSDAEAGGEKQ